MKKKGKGKHSVPFLFKEKNEKGETQLRPVRALARNESDDDEYKAIWDKLTEEERIFINHFRQAY